MLFCIKVRLSFLSAPPGPAAFHLKSVAPPEISWSTSIGQFVCLQLLVLLLVLFFPWRATALL